MKVYKAEEKWILGLLGGQFNDLKKDPEAVILKNYPDPIKMWQVKTLIEENNSKNEYWEYDYTFREHKGDENKKSNLQGMNLVFHREKLSIL